MVKQRGTPAILGPKGAMNLEVTDWTSLLSSDRGPRDRGDFHKGDLDSDGLLLVWVREDGGKTLSFKWSDWKKFFLPSHATGLWCIHLVLSWIHCMCQVVCWYVNKTHLDLLPALSEICGIALNMFLYLLEVQKMFSATALQKVEVVLLSFN